jgi:hypothetical protein
MQSRHAVKNGSEQMMPITVSWRIFPWVIAALMSCLFCSLSIMSVLSWGLYDWSNAYAPAWERSVSHASAGLLIALNGLSGCLAPFALLVSMKERMILGVVRPIWILGMWLLLTGLGLLLTMLVVIWGAWRPEVVEVLAGWWLFLLCTNFCLQLMAIMVLVRSGKSSGGSHGGVSGLVRCVRLLHLLIAVRCVVVISVAYTASGDVFGTAAGPVDDTPRTLEFLFWVELALSLVLLSLSAMPSLGYGRRIIALAIVVCASVAAWCYSVFVGDSWYPVWLTGVPLLLVTYGILGFAKSRRNVPNSGSSGRLRNP